MIKIKKRKILLLPGDGIGPEVIAEVKKIIEWFNSNKSLDFEIDQDLVGGAAYDKHGTPITDEAFYKAQESAAVIQVLLVDQNGIILIFQKNQRELY